MYLSEDRIDKGLFSPGPGSHCGLIHNDHLATPQKMTNASGTVVWSADYKPFGEVNITTSDITNNLRFPGQYHDQETGLYYNYYRDYNPALGRYPQADPVGIKRGENHLYVYTSNNPLNRTDPRGLQECKKNCEKDAPNLLDSSSECDKYGTKTYLGGSVKCFCKCAGNSAWSQKVRGCLRCKAEQNADMMDAHLSCYSAANATGLDQPTATLGYCYTVCLFKDDYKP